MCTEDGPEPEWCTVKGIDKVEVVSGTRWAQDTPNTVQRCVTFVLKDKGLPNGRFHERIDAIYCPSPAPAPARDAGTKGQEPVAASSAVALADRYWADAGTQARSTAKWLASILGAVLAFVVGAAPLTRLDGMTDTWRQVPVLLIVLGVALLGATLYLVTSVLVPGITTLADLMVDRPQPAERTGWRLWLHRLVTGPACGAWTAVTSRLVVKAARAALARKTAQEHGVLLPIGLRSFSELGHRVRIEEITLNGLAAGSGRTQGGLSEKPLWKDTRQARARWLQVLIDEATQWTTVANYLSIRVRSNRARSIGLLTGLSGAVLVVAGYLSLETSAVGTAEPGTYVVQHQAEGNPLGKDCELFRAVPVGGSGPQVRLFVVGGTGCTRGSVTVDPDDIAVVRPEPSPSAS